MVIGTGVGGEGSHPETNVFVVQQKKGCMLPLADGKAKSVGPFVCGIAECTGSRKAIRARGKKNSPRTKLDRGQRT